MALCAARDTMQATQAADCIYAATIRFLLITDSIVITGRRKSATLRRLA